MDLEFQCTGFAELGPQRLETIFVDTFSDLCLAESDTIQLIDFRVFASR